MKSKRRSRRLRRGAIAILTAAFLIVLLGMVALALDIGYIVLTDTQLQAAADSAALAGGTELLPGLGINKTKTPAEVETAAKARAVEYAANNRAGEQTSVYADEDRDVQLGNAYYDAGAGAWQKSWGTSPYNMVGVNLLKNQAGSENGDAPLPLLFGPIIGADTANVTALATAVIMPAEGFKIDAGTGETSSIMPFAYRKSVWYRRRDAQKWYDSVGRNPALINANIAYTASAVDSLDPYDTLTYPRVYGPTNPLFYRLDRQGAWVRDIFDNYTHNSDGVVTAGADGILEVDMYPESNTAGNSGTIDLGGTDNSAAVLTRQILYGLDESDWAAMDEQGLLNGDGEFTFVEGALDTEGDTGISNMIKTALEAVIDKPKTIMLFDEVVNPGNNAIYTLGGFAGATVLKVEMTGNPKHVWIQPAKVVDATAIADLTEQVGDNDSIFTPLILIE